MDKFINKVIQGDCLEILKTFPNKSVDLIVTDHSSKNSLF